MILSSAPSSSLPALVPGGEWLLAGTAAALYVLALLPRVGRALTLRRLALAALLGAFVLHGLLLAIDIGGFGQADARARWGFGPVLSMTAWLVIAVHAVESRLIPLPAVRQWLGAAGALAVTVAAMFPGEPRPIHSMWAPLHFALGVASYGLFGAAVLHAMLLDAAERRLRGGGGAARASAAGPSLPLLQLERLTFRFVQAGFVALSVTLLLGVASAGQWRWSDHKAIFSVLAWATFAALLLGRHWRGWRGRHATRWLYAGATLLMLAYVGSRFVLEVLLGRGPA